jgi:hypothetical protein
LDLIYVTSNVFEARIAIDEVRFEQRDMLDLSTSRPPKLIPADTLSTTLSFSGA